jgi:Skp family chaperone for outer membrane proteins
MPVEGTDGDSSCHRENSRSFPVRDTVTDEMGLFRRRTPEEIERMKAEMASLREALERQEARESPPDPGKRLDELASKLAELDARVTSVSTELANQIAELGNDLDALDNRPPNAAADGAVIGELRDGQVHLANEQARYQIAFREDLARLAEQLRRSP